MRRETLQFTLITVLLLGSCGCGTLIANAVTVGTGSPPNIIYGGVQADVEQTHTSLVEITEGPDGDESLDFPIRLIAGVNGLIALIDLPFSAVADTVLLPWTIPNSKRLMASKLDESSSENVTP